MHRTASLKPVLQACHHRTIGIEVHTSLGPIALRVEVRRVRWVERLVNHRVTQVVEFLAQVVAPIHADAPAGWHAYWYADPLAAFLGEQAQVALLLRQLSSGRPLIVTEADGRSCTGCGRAGTSPCCTVCGTRRALPQTRPCQPSTHQQLPPDQAHCGACGIALPRAAASTPGRLDRIG